MAAMSPAECACPKGMREAEPYGAICRIPMPTRPTPWIVKSEAHGSLKKYIMEKVSENERTNLRKDVSFL